uniref:ACT_3 domain-containing protein n=1 Tax=Steinernema glaseri TaxID=37863 RepID=A0A1I7YJI6_9BILA
MAETPEQDHYLLVSSSSRKLFQGSTTISPPCEEALFDLLQIDGESMKTKLCPKEVLDLLATRGFRVVSAVFTAWEEHVWTLSRI